MPPVLVCSHDPLFVRNCCGALRTDGYDVQTVEHTAEAVRMTLDHRYRVVVLDGGCIGMKAGEAARIIQWATGIPVIIAGAETGEAWALKLERPVNVQEVRQAVRSACQSLMERR